MHCPVSRAVIQRGIAILCEKPLATSLAEGAAAWPQRREAPRPIHNICAISAYRNSCALQAAARVDGRRNEIGDLRHVIESELFSELAVNARGAIGERARARLAPLTAYGKPRRPRGHRLPCLRRHGAPLRRHRRKSMCPCAALPRTYADRLGEYVLDANDSFPPRSRSGTARWGDPLFALGTAR